ncbi:phosphonate transport system substrate-binding protein [Dongia mobilis]|uniref:Phosphonate transport system substrate-binding protein n=1 Tax=Dongia mobilis TaxID=578943 RepID=A0A4V3DF00_9PROT|nr:phosphate/phosphite/phosphonate ABC transporter substrate-binding protein [Dongia mobilis]TDQ84131.1 phosphonate transport system substrate-binding protein [Dongia mobilis]
MTASTGFAIARRTLLAAAASLPLVFQANLAAAAEKIRFAVTDIAGLEDLQREYGALVEALEKATGYEIKFTPVNSRTAAVEAMRAKQVDFVLTGPAEYVVFKRRTEANVVIGFQRPDYFAMIVTLAESPIEGPADLKGKKVAFGDVGSTSAHLGPMQVLADFGIDPIKDIEPLHVSRNVAVESLIKGDIAAIGMNATHLVSVRNKFPDTAFKVVARGRDLPNDPLLAGAHVDQTVIDKMRTAFIDNQQVLIEALLKGEDTQKYKGMHFLAGIDDKNYDYVRRMYATIGYPEYSEFVGQ